MKYVFCVSDGCSAKYVSVMSDVANFAVGAGGVARYPPPFPVDEYILQCFPQVDERRFEMLPVGQTMTLKIGSEVRETAYEGWRCRWKY